MWKCGNVRMQKPWVFSARSASTFSVSQLASQMKDIKQMLALAIHVFNPCTQRQRQADLRVQGQLGLQSKLQDSQGYQKKTPYPIYTSVCVHQYAGMYACRHQRTTLYNSFLGCLTCFLQDRVSHLLTSMNRPYQLAHRLPGICLFVSASHLTITGIVDVLHCIQLITGFTG